MPSSISNSSSTALTHAKALAGISAILMLSLEVGANYVLQHYSATYTRVTRQYAEAVRVRPSRGGRPLSVLMVGNSLLMEGIEVNRLQELTSGRARIYPIFLEATGYYDWLYGLRRLFRQGARPEVVVLGVGVESFLANGMRPEYAPMMLFDSEDVLGVSSDLDLDRTTISNLVLAHSSAFWDIRNVLRAEILRRILPHGRELFALIKTRPMVPADPELEAIAVSRLRALRELCGMHSAKLILLIPPTPSSENGVRLLRAASHQVGVESLVPLDPATLSQSLYQPDAIHLNAEGAALFTTALASDLPEKLGQRGTGISPN
jgi:hypothetical protein